MGFLSWGGGSNSGSLFLLFALCLAVRASVTVEDTSLVQLHVIWRHGNRTRVTADTYPADPYKNISDPEGVGNLNRRGKARAYQLGRTLRARYGEFLGEDYQPEIHQVRSTDKRRAMDSALLVLAGLFPPSPRQTWTSIGNEELGRLWQPIQITVEPRDKDNLLGNIKVHCPRRNEELSRVRTSDKVKTDENRISNNGTIFEYVSSYSRELVNDSIISQGVHNALMCEEDQGWTLPEWTKSVYPEPLRSLAGLGLGQFGRTKLLQRLIVGPLLEFMISSSEKASDASEPKFRGYSGHDSNLVTLLAAFNLTDLSNTIPKYSAHIAWEVRKSPSSNDTYVRILYEDNELHIPGCDFKPLCKLQQLRESLSEILITREQHWKECEAHFRKVDNADLPVSAANAKAIISLNVCALMFFVSALRYSGPF